MIRTRDGFLCCKCWNAAHAKPAVQLKNARRTKMCDYVYVFDDQEVYPKIKRECPKCGNKEALHWFSGISGEHAGVARERTVEHFKCTGCSYSWTESF
jgi:DNA-directed RNA polymerase subunit M/transcription elongation factor TFIIS